MSATPHLNVVACDTSRLDWSACVARLGVTDLFCLVWFTPPAGVHRHSPFDRAPRAASPALPTPCRKVHVGEPTHVPHARPSQTVLRWTRVVQQAIVLRLAVCVLGVAWVTRPPPFHTHVSAAGRHLVSAPPLGVTCAGTRLTAALSQLARRALTICHAMPRWRLHVMPPSGRACVSTSEPGGRPRLLASASPR